MSFCECIYPSRIISKSFSVVASKGLSFEMTLKSVGPAKRLVFQYGKNGSQMACLSLTMQRASQWNVHSNGFHASFHACI